MIRITSVSLPIALQIKLCEKPFAGNSELMSRKSAVHHFIAVLLTLEKRIISTIPQLLSKTFSR